MSAPLGLRCSLGRHLVSPVNAEDLDRMRQRAWRYQGVAVLRPEDIQDPWLRQALVNEATRRYGPREAGR
jgi:hypothetical protein